MACTQCLLCLGPISNHSVAPGYKGLSHVPHLDSRVLCGRQQHNAQHSKRQQGHQSPGQAPALKAILRLLDYLALGQEALAG